MKRFASFAEQARSVLTKGDWEKLGTLINANFDLRRSICNIAPSQLEMVEVARKAGVTAKFSGSGGAIIGTYPDERVFKKLTSA